MDAIGRDAAGTALDDPNALWRAVRGYAGTSPEDVRAELWARFRRVAALRVRHDGDLNAAGRRLLAHAAFSLLLDAREGTTYPVASLFVAQRTATSAQRFRAWGARRAKGGCVSGEREEMYRCMVCGVMRPAGEMGYCYSCRRERCFSCKQGGHDAECGR
ncbi:MAG: hypothetical protein KGK07_15705 [Chloroflexota bacterium]|nr:hypothetical protein [Chloroflexota bacterium]